MKKIVKYVLLVVSLLLISQTPVSANDNQSYVSDNEESPISHIVFTPDNVQITVNNEAAEARKLYYYYLSIQMKPCLLKWILMPSPMIYKFYKIS